MTIIQSSLCAIFGHTASYTYGSFLPRRCERCGRSLSNGLPVTSQTVPMPPVKPPGKEQPMAARGEDAAVEAMCKIEFQNERGPWFLYDFNARKILAAIRRGEVTGCWYNDETYGSIREDRDRLAAELDLANSDCAEKQAAIEKFLDSEKKDGETISRLTAELEQARRDLAASKVTIDVDAKILAAAKQMESERAAARRDAEAARAELAQIKREYTRLERACVSWMEAKKRASADFDAAQARLATLEKELAAERAAREKAEKACGELGQRALECAEERDAAQARLAEAEKELTRNARAWRGLEKMPYEVKPESEAALRRLGKRQADRLDAFIARR